LKPPSRSTCARPALRGYNSDLQLVIDGPAANQQAFLQKVESKLATVDNVDHDSIAAMPVANDIAFIAFKSVSGPQDAATAKLVTVLRDGILPPLHKGTGTNVYVYGTTAVFSDFASVLSAKMPYFILAVIGLSFLLLMLAFRSVAIPFTAAVMNVLAAAASFGVTVAIFQWGWFGSAIGVGAGGPIDAFQPVLLFAILFGLSMDYQVFLVSRMHEEWIRTNDNHRAVTVGQSETGGIITAAGLIMIAVFAGFALGDDRTIKMLGIGLASAVLLDAFVVRTMLVPAIMHRVGRANWWYPAWLDKLTPHVSIEAPEKPAHEPAPKPVGVGN
jgi:RND superfamily putative drug exporter